MQPLPLPLRGGPIEALAPFLNLASDNDFLLVVAWLFLRPNPPDMSMESLRKFVISTPQGPDKLATILSQEAKKLLAMDRYERRALSRRKFAIRAFDEARRRSSRDCNNLMCNCKLYFGRTKPKWSMFLKPRTRQLPLTVDKPLPT
jgi:hypothetical protein